MTNLPLRVMKLFLVALFASLLCGIGSFAADLGNTAFVGDSITHGYGTSGYRFGFWKILKDNEVKHHFVGVNKGNSHGYNKPLNYRGEEFNNEHSAGSSWRTYQTSGDYMQGDTQNGVGPSSMPCGGYIANWLGLEDKASYKKVPGGKLKKGQYLRGNAVADFDAGKYPLMTGTRTPDTVLIMLGTNDFYSDKADRYSNELVFGFMENILSFCRQANPKMNIVLMSMPDVPAAKNQKGNVISKAYNQFINNRLASLQKGVSKVMFADMNKGMTGADGYLSPLMTVDNLHPNEQGNLLFAGNLARAMGVGQRTAGLPRILPHKLPVNVKTVGKPSFSAHWKAGNRFTLACAVKVDKGSANTPLTIRTGNGKVGDGVLSIHPDRITWGEKNETLYIDDMTSAPHVITISLIDGNDVDPGYYVWLDGQLIAEAKTPAASAGSNDQVLIESGGKAGALVHVAYDARKAFAPDMVRKAKPVR